MECSVNNSAKMFRQETGNFSLFAQKSHSSGFSQNYFLKVFRSAGHVESLPSSSTFPFDVFLDT